MAEHRVDVEGAPFEWDAVIHQLSDGMVVVGRDGRTISINDTARLLLGLRAGARTLEEYWAGADVRGPDGVPLAPERWPISRALRGELVLNQELRVGRADGAEAVISSSAVPLVGARGEPWGAAVVMREITREARQRDRLEVDRADAERRARELAELAAAAGEVVGTLSVDEQLVRIARRAAAEGVSLQVVCPRANRPVRLVVDLRELRAAVPIVESAGLMDGEARP